MVTEEQFIKFLNKHKINPEKWKKINPKEYERSFKEFSVIGEKNFFERKRFFINNWRKQFPLK